MKKSLFFVFSMALVLVSCTRIQEIEVPDASLSLIAKTESSTDSRTVVEGGVHVYWEPDDEIMVFTGEKSAKFVSDLTASSATATFKGTFGEEAWPEDMDLWAVYPFNEEAVFDGETITTILPPEQVARPGSFGKDMNLAIAHSTGTTLQFYNVGGGIRFSVTEEGIKKVIFEGLSGEIISGKVKIGFSEDGKPEVREVTGGSQFVTLLPPSGQETFQKDSWYYIIAIPGALEKGYKLRFYKDADYARKVSEKPVEIKRSIFGNIEKADEGLEFEAQTTHFPKTEEEWRESIQLSESASTTISELIDDYQNGRQDLSSLTDAMSKIEGILKVETVDDASVIMIMQKDSVWINCMTEDYVSSLNTGSNKTELSAGSRSHTRSFSQKGSRKEPYISKGKKALILAPFQNEFNSPLDTWETILKEHFEIVDVYPNEEASITRFRESFLCQYDFILIDTHGGQGHLAVNQGHLPHLLTYHLTTSTRYSVSGMASLLLLDWDPKELTITLHDGDLYMCMTPQFLKDKKLDDCGVILSACKSAFKMNNFTEDDHNGSMMGAFLNNGARLVSGAADDMATGAQDVFDEMMIRYMSNGLSFQAAYNYITNSEKASKVSQGYHNYFSDTEYSRWDIPHNYRYKARTDTGNEPFYFFNPFPTDLDYVLGDEDVCLTWNCNLTSFSIPWKDRISTDSHGSHWDTVDYQYHVNYDVFVDGAPLDETLDIDDTDKKATIPLCLGNHKWYVVAKITEGDTVIASYQSETGEFDIKKEYAVPEVKDLGLSVKWASFNLGATKQEEYGDYFAWGETEPYYQSLDPLVWKKGKEDGYFWPSYKWCMGTKESMTKYCATSDYGYNGFVDGKSVLDPEDDAAHVNLGGNWRTPTYDELMELRSSRCTWEWTSINGVDGYKVTGPNGNFIFLPAAGYFYKTTLYVPGERGFYESSSLYEDMSFHKLYLVFYQDYKGAGYYLRSDGQSIRPVYDDQ